MTRSEPYHHANLRKTLLDAAVTLIGEVGPRAFTLREVARRAGVSHNAPYRHFVSKDELLAEVAAEGFDRLTASMRKSMARATSPRERLQQCGCGYVAFALRWPQHFLVMFDLPQPHMDRKSTRPPGKMPLPFYRSALPPRSSPGISRLAICCLWLGWPGRLFMASPNWPSAEIFPSTPAPPSNLPAAPPRQSSAA